MVSLRLRKICKSFETTQILRDIDLEVISGEFMVLVGPSGCGKSTLLRTIAGLEEANAGDLYIGERRVNDVEPRDRGVAMVFQSYALYPHMSVRENMAFGLTIRKASRETIDARVAHAAQMLDLEPYLDRLPRQLSGGQRQRVAMGRAIVRHPDVFLFDEPLSNLDAALRTQMRVELKKLHERLGTTMIYVTHDQVEAMTLADRIAVLRAGELQQVGTPKELFHLPRNRFVAGFIGSPAMNFLAGRAVCKTCPEVGDRASGREWLFEGEGFSFSAGFAVGDDVPASMDGAVLCGIRPQHWTVVADYSSVREGDAVLEGRLDVVEMMGWEAMVHIRVGPHAVTALVPAHQLEGRQPGSPIVLAVPREYLMYFDAHDQRIDTPKALVTAAPPGVPVLAMDVGHA